MKKIATLLIMLLVVSICHGQSNSSDYSKIIKKRAETMTQHLIKKDFRSFCEYTYPKILELIGGKEKAIALMEKGSKELQAEGNEFSKVTIGEPSRIISNGTELQCTVPQSTELKVTNGKLVTESTLIAISKDKGVTWYFIDTSNKSLKSLQKAFPNLSNMLEIPESKQPIFYPN